MPDLKSMMLKDIVEVNPSESMSKKQIYKKIAMGQLNVFTKKIQGFEQDYFNGGAKFRNNDTLVAKITPCLENGKTAFVDILDNNEVGFGSTEFITLRANDNSDPHFIYYLAISPYFRENAIGLMTGTSGRKRVDEKLLECLNILVPPSKQEQQKIASVLSALDAKIDLNNRINQELEAMAKTLYDYWFVQFEFPNEDGKPYKSSGGKMTYNPELKREIPEGWEVKTFNEIGSIVGGSTPSKSNDAYFTTNGTPWITPKDLSVNTGKTFISKGEISVTQEGIKSASLQIYPKGTVLLSSRAPIGYTAISSNPVTTNQGFKSFIADKGYSEYFIYLCVNSNIKTITANASGSTFKEISGSVLKGISLCLPNNKLTELFNSKIISVFKQKQIVEQQNQKLAEIRDFLLPLLMNGQVGVK